MIAILFEILFDFFEKWESLFIDETISTLRFASRMAKVSNEPVLNVQLDPNILIRKYEREIRDLKLELAMHDTLVGRGRINYEPYTPEQQFEQQKLAQKFLDGEIEDISVESIRQAMELFFQFKNIYRGLVKDLQNNNTAGIQREKSQVDMLRKGTTKHMEKASPGVGDEENKYGFGVGRAPKDAKPTYKIDPDTLVNIPKQTAPEAPKEEGTSPENKLNSSGQAVRQPPIDKEKVWFLLHVIGSLCFGIRSCLATIKKKTAGNSVKASWKT